MVILALVCFAAGALLVLGIYFCVSDLTNGRKRKVATEHGKDAAAREQLFLGDVDVTSAATTRAQSGDHRLSWDDRLRIWIDQSGLQMSPAALIGMTCCAGLAPAAIVWLLLHKWWLAAIAYVLPSILPVTYVHIRRQHRSNRLREQLPDALDLMSRMLRAGQTIAQSLRGVADEFDSPIGDEFGYCYEQQNLGLSTDASMYEMARRTGVLELRILVVALTVHRQSGGNLSELLDNLAAVIRDRYRVYGQIRSLTADGRMQAAILLGLPPFLMAALSVINRDYITILFQYPWLLVGMFGFELFGALWLRRIVAFDF